ncbi:MAG TPA: hypothetical protein VN026_17275, partial [Bacteroidia bacterium]|nr:hypothetical protein [Bacteroidia bacterium]
MELTNKEKIKIIKTNLHLKDYKLALKLEINKYELHKFCIQNKIKLAPEKYIVKYIKSNPNMSLGIIRRTTGFNKEEINKLMGNNPTCRINAYKTNKNMKKEKIINNDDKYNIEKASVEVIKLLFKDKPNCSRKQYASILGISERTLYRHMVKYKIS